MKSRISKFYGTFFGVFDLTVKIEKSRKILEFWFFSKFHRGAHVSDQLEPIKAKKKGGKKKKNKVKFCEEGFDLVFFFWLVTTEKNGKKCFFFLICFQKAEVLGG